MKVNVFLSKLKQASKEGGVASATAVTCYDCYCNRCDITQDIRPEKKKEKKKWVIWNLRGHKLAC